MSDLAQLKGKRIALGTEGSGDRVVCEKILAAAGITYDNATLLSVAPQDVIKALDDGKIDAVFRNFSPDSPILDALLKGPQYRLHEFYGGRRVDQNFSLPGTRRVAEGRS